MDMSVVGGQLSVVSTTRNKKVSSQSVKVQQQKQLTTDH
jgi:hypothetical protein